MEFINKEHFDSYLNCLTCIGQGSQGICYLDSTRNIVIKVFHDYFFDEDSEYKEEEILKFSSIKNNTFLWPLDVIKVSSIVVGYISTYKRMKNLYMINPLLVNLDKLEEGIIKTEEDFKIVSKEKVKLYDVRYNILYKNGKFNVIDTMEYAFRNVSYKENIEALDKEVMLFLVDGFFDEFVLNDSLLSKIYMEYGVSCRIFLHEFRKKLNKYAHNDIKRLNDARILVRRKDDGVYKREIK